MLRRRLKSHKQKKQNFPFSIFERRTCTALLASPVGRPLLASWFQRTLPRRASVAGDAAEALAVERDGARAPNHLDVFQPQRLAARGRQFGIFDLPPGLALAKDDLRPL